MTFVATALRLTIASPSDIREARDTVELATYCWNVVV